MCRRALIAGVFALSILPAPLCGAADQWVEIKSAHFTVVSSAGQSPARDLAWQLEQIRSAIATIWPWARLDLSRPFLVFAARDEQSMRALVPRYWEVKGSVHPASVWIEGPDRYYLAVRTDLKAEDYRNRNPYLTSYFSYVSLVLQQSVTRPLPMWLERGLAGVLSNTVVSEQHVQVGPAIPGYLRDLQSGPRSRIADLVTMTATSPAFSGDEGMRKFDAQSWALVHMLWFGDQGAHAVKLQHYLDAVMAGGDPKTSFQEAIGSPESLELPLSVYATRTLFSFQQLQVDAAVKREAFPQRVLTVSESASMRALLHTAMNRPTDARAAIGEARQAGPAPESYVAEAELLEREGKTADAQAAYQRAVDAGSTSGFAYRRLATLMWGTAPDHDRLVQISKVLAQGIALNTRDDYAYAMLGEAHSALGEQDGLGFARRAISLAPYAADHHLAAARILARERKFDDAQKEIQAATELARSDEEQQRIREFTQWLNRARTSGGA